MKNAIELNHVSKIFGSFQAVQDLSFEVQEGSLFGFLGPNGSGKSTTLRMLMGLIKPSSGDILFQNQSLQLHRAAIMQRIGCMIEKPDFYGYLTALDNLKLVARASGLNQTSADLENLLERVGLTGKGKQKVKTYSHGMKQRLGLAQVLLHNPSIIILDEPNTGLDPQGILDLRNLLIQLNKEEGKTILFSSHILSEVQEICTDMVVIHKGKRVAQGKVADLLSDEILQVQIEVYEQDRLREFITQSSWQSVAEHYTEKSTVLKMEKQRIPQLINELTAQNFSILKVDYKNPLEAYFLKLTHEN
jgi:ABC-type multidrug transport system ATPase subunit